MIAIGPMSWVQRLPVVAGIIVPITTFLHHERFHFSSPACWRPQHRPGGPGQFEIPATGCRAALPSRAYPWSACRPCATWPAPHGARRAVACSCKRAHSSGPVTQGPVEVAVKVLREGKNVRQIQAEVQQEGQTAALLLGVFGSERSSSVAPVSPKMPPAPLTPEQIAPRALPPGVSPHFTQHMDMRFAEGAAPFTGKVCPLTRIHIKMQGEPVSGIATELLTVLLADVPPSPLLSQFTKQTPASSVSWELELRPLPKNTEGWWRVDTEVLAAAGGYSNQVTHLWSPDGELAAFGYQVVTVYG